jgi:AcrR family transcriptional regulator
MSRHADEALEGHILDAAYALWKKGGEKALTMRAVAKAAKTTTPTVYERFRDKPEILESLRRRAQQNLFAVLRGARALDDFPRLYLDFALKHKHEYELIHLGWAARFGRNEARPSFEFLKERLARELGGEAAEYTQLALSMAALAHGTASLLHVEGVHESVIGNLRDACLSGFRAMVEHTAHKRGGNPRGGGTSQDVGKRGKRGERAAK